MSKSKPASSHTHTIPPGTAATTLPTRDRVHSLDQFRGYAVAGMFVVNFCGGLNAIPDVFKHHNTYFSWADSIMPAFMFAAGFSYRLTMLKRIPRDGAWQAYSHAFRRGLALVFVSLAMYGFNSELAKAWEEVNGHEVWDFVAGLIKGNLWETLAIIGVSQIIIMPFIAKRTSVVALGLLGLLVGHTLFSHFFNIDFMNGQPNWLDQFWGAEKQTAWDGGVFGNMTWGAIMLGGALVHDLIIGKEPHKSMMLLFGFGTVVMLIAYGLSCFSTYYDVTPDTPIRPRDLAENPVFPSKEQREASPLSLAPPPFVAPPPRNAGEFQKLEEAGKAPDPPRIRPYNYWMMSKRITTTPFSLFSIGFSAFTLGLFVLLTDIGGIKVGLFRTFGTNALAAYFLHHSIEYAVLDGIVPKDSPLWWALCGLVIFYVWTYMFVRFLEKQKVFIRL
ncbi:MAG: heparan-alpha-glucosaminide N-acetyltransferase domain-containing protein [Planctomycetaceae bacterium]